MKTATLLFLVLTALGAGFLAGFSYSQREQVSAASFAVAGPANAGPYEGSHDHHMAMAGGSAAPPGAVTVSPLKQQMIGVRVGTVEEKAATSRLRLYGRVVAEETRLYTLNVGIDGLIRQISNVTTGSHVRKDEWLATFSAPEARLPIQGYLVALDVLDRELAEGAGGAALEQARGSVQQSVDRLLTLGMSSVQVEEIARTRQLPPNIRVTAPEDGFVVERRVSIGQKFERGDELYRIADLRRVWILADVFGRDAESIRPGMDAEVSLPGRGRTLRARVSGDVPPQFDQASQSLKVRFEVENPRYVLRPGMPVDVEVPIAFPAAIAVPVEAVVDSGVKQIVFVERSQDAFEVREVKTGWRARDFVEIVSGLSVGDRIVVSGTFFLAAQSRIRRIAR